MGDYLSQWPDKTKIRMRIANIGNIIVSYQELEQTKPIL